MKKYVGKSVNSKGLTLIEVLAVLVILGILAAIAVPSIVGLIEKSKEDICVANRVELRKLYDRHLALEDEEDSEVVFREFLLIEDFEVCPEDGVIRYVDGEIECSVHSVVNGEEKDDDNDEGGVPYL